MVQNMWDDEKETHWCLEDFDAVMASARKLWSQHHRDCRIHVVRTTAEPARTTAPEPLARPEAKVKAVRALPKPLAKEPKLEPKTEEPSASSKGAPELPPGLAEIPEMSPAQKKAGTMMGTGFGLGDKSLGKSPK